MPELAEVGDFCPNDSCSDAGKTDEGNIVKCHDQGAATLSLKELWEDLLGKHRNDFLRAGTSPPRRSSRFWPLSQKEVA